MRIVASLIILFFTVQLKAQMDTTSYSVGMIIAKNLKSQGLSEIDQASFNKAIQDVFEGKELAISLEEANENFRNLFDKAQSVAESTNKKAGLEFLEENTKRSGVVMTESGLQYEVIEESSEGDIRPSINNTVKVHYHGTLIDGTVFDSSIERNEPISFPVNGVIIGWQEGLQLMRVGSKYRFFVPYDLAYGSKAAGPTIKPFSTLIFDVTLLAIE